jgi:hypothetical protein
MIPGLIWKRSCINLSVNNLYTSGIYIYIYMVSLCVSGNVCKQTSPEIPEVTCTKRTIMGFFHETSLMCVISLGVKLWLVYFRHTS